MLKKCVLARSRPRPRSRSRRARIGNVDGFFNTLLNMRRKIIAVFVATWLLSFSTAQAVGLPKRSQTTKLAATKRLLKDRVLPIAKKVAMRGGVLGLFMVPAVLGALGIVGP